MPVKQGWRISLKFTRDWQLQSTANLGMGWANGMRCYYEGKAIYSNIWKVKHCGILHLNEENLSQLNKFANAVIHSIVWCISVPCTVIISNHFTNKNIIDFDYPHVLWLTHQCGWGRTPARCPGHGWPSGWLQTGDMAMQGPFSMFFPSQFKFDGHFFSLAPRF